MQKKELFPEVNKLGYGKYIWSTILNLTNNEFIDFVKKYKLLDIVNTEEAIKNIQEKDDKKCLINMIVSLNNKKEWAVRIHYNYANRTSEIFEKKGRRNVHNIVKELGFKLNKPK